MVGHIVRAIMVKIATSLKPIPIMREARPVQIAKG
jgi:hypothetical protein